MGEIAVLDKSIFNRIAAGEVVERPYSVVKELLDNSIDAGAKHVNILIKNGGISFIKVEDDGKGILKEDIKKAFLPHATSKVKTISDLDKIYTLGFRGEALPSIASVAKVTMISRTAESEFATKYLVDNGAEIDFGEIGSKYGTSVTVEGLFEKIPARRKFLSKESIEENAITSLIIKYILANHFISFTYVVDDKEKFEFDGKGKESAIKTVYGNEFFENLLDVHSTISDIVLCGYIGKPSFTKHSKSYQTLIVNGRYVENDEISYIVFSCFKKFLMKRQFPVYLLYLNVPYDLVDVNVHPNKMEIKFAADSLIKKLVYNAVESKVSDASKIPGEIKFYAEDSNLHNISQGQPDLYKHQDEKEQTEKIDSTILGIEINEPRIFNNANKLKEPRDYQLNLEAYSSLLAGENIKNFIVEKVKSPLVKNKEEQELYKEGDKLSTVSAYSYKQDLFLPKDNYNIVGKVFNTYIIVENGDNLYLFDQHAAHEKLLYDKFTQQYNKSDVFSQKLLIPYKFEVPYEELETFKTRLPKLSELGFEVQHLDGNIYNLISLPLLVSDLDLKEFIAFIVNGNQQIEGFSEALMQHSCKSAIKATDNLSEDDIRILLSEMKEKNISLFCPHGRPIIIKFSKIELDKLFKRLV